jgi:uncharacterized membrane protein
VVGRPTKDDVSARREPRTHRTLLVVAAIGLFAPALTAWSSIVELPAVGALATCGFVMAFALVVFAALSSSERSLARLDWAVLILAVALLGAWSAAQLYFNPAYGTDEAAFVQAAAQKLLHGDNPYAANLISAFSDYRVPVQLATYKLDGTIASNLAYPSLSFLLVVPAILLTHGVQAVILANVFFLAVGMILVFLFVPRTYRALSVVVVLGLPFLFTSTLGGVISTLSVPFMLVVAHRWREIGQGGRLAARGRLQAICLGLAVSVCQLTWFLAPFIVLGLVILRARELGRRAGGAVVARFIAIVFGTAALLNAPFISWSPKAWLSDVSSPLVQHAVPLGQGLVDATVFFHLGGGNLAYFTYAAVACLVALLAVYAAYFDRLWRVTFVLPPLIFLFSTRPLSGYITTLVPIWLVSLLAPGDATTQPARLSVGFGRRKATAGLKRHRAGVAVLAVSAASGLVFLALALTATPPLAITIKSVRTNGEFQGIWRIEAFVANRSHSRLKPHFATDSSGYMSSFWNVIGGPPALAPGESALYELVAPNVGSMPGVTQPFALHAVTASPETISSSTRFKPNPIGTYISPSYVNSVVPLGKAVTVTVQLRSPYGAEVHQSGVPIALGQVIHGQNALIMGEASINNAAEGRSPVIAQTDENGLATFRIRQNWNQDGYPLYFEAWVDPPGGFPYGYSEVVSVQWGTHRMRG